jgi:predicted metal-dependent hydrolase
MILSQTELKELITKNFPPSGAPDMYGAFLGMGNEVHARTQRIIQQQETANKSDSDELNPQELRDLAAKLAKMDTEDEMRAAMAGNLSGRAMVNYFSFLDKRIMQAKTNDAKARQDALYMAFLQAQIANLEANIEALDVQIEALDDLLEIIDSDEPLDPNNPAHRAILGRSGIPEEKWGTITRANVEEAIRERKEERAETLEKLEKTQAELSFMKGKPLDQATDIAEQTVEKQGAATVEAVSETLGAREMKMADTAAGEGWYEGNGTDQDILADNLEELGQLDLGDDLPGGGTSFANAADPQSTLRNTAPQIQAHFETASHQIAPVMPDAQINLTSQREPETPPPPGAMG